MIGTARPRGIPLAARAVSSAVLGLAALAALGGLVLLSVPGADGYDITAALLAAGLTSVPAAGCALIRADRRSRLGWLLLVSGAGTILKLVLDQYARGAYTHGAALPHPALAAFAAQFGTLGQLALGAAVPLVLLGRLPAGRRWRVAAVGALALVMTSAVGNFAATFWHYPQVANPWRLPGASAGVSDAADLLVIVGQNACYIAAALAVGAALRQAQAAADGPPARARLRGLVLLRRAAWLVVTAYLICLVLGGTGAQLAVYAGEHFALLVFAVCAWTAISRFGLADARQILDRALRYGVLTALILAIYAGLLAGIDQVAARHIPPLVAVAIAALIALPLRDAAQRVVARLVWGQASEPSVALNLLGQELTAAALPAQTLAAAAATVAESLRVQQVTIENTRHEVLARWARGGPVRPAAADLEPADLGPPSPEPVISSPMRPRPMGPGPVESGPVGSGPVESSPVESGPMGPGAMVTAPLTFAGQPAGRLVLTLRPGETRLPRRSARLLAGVSPQLAAAVQALASAAALTASRQRLLVLRDEERRRIRRDLHDGLGPALAGIGLGIERARETIDTSPGQASATLAELGTHARRAVTDVRRLVHDLYPSALAELGLARAIAADAERLGASFVAGPRWPEASTSVPEAVESAAYRIALEALTNAVRHAGASEISVRLDVAAGPALAVEVRDDGRGLDPAAPPGLGLRSMRDRAQEIGGTLTVSAPAGAGGSPPGMVVRAVLPLAALDTHGLDTPSPGTPGSDTSSPDTFSPDPQLADR
jgi:two-component system NarL family sensor kinase